MKLAIYSAVVVFFLAILALANLGAGALMIFSPALIPSLLKVEPSVFGVPSNALWLGRAYGERLIIVGLILTALIFRRDRAGLLWIPVLDEVLNAGLDGFEVVSGTLSFAGVGQILLFHVIAAVIFGALWGLRPGTAAAPASKPVARPAPTPLPASTPAPAPRPLPPVQPAPLPPVETALGGAKDPAPASPSNNTDDLETRLAFYERLAEKNPEKAKE